MNYDTIKQLHDQVISKKTMIADLNESIKSTNKDILHLDDVLSLLKQSKNYKIESRKSFILDIINRALDEIIHDKTITVDIASTKSKSSKFNILYDFVVYKNGREIARNNKIFDTTGGGVISIISFILKIMMGYINTGNKFYIFDESFAQLSEDYLNSLSLFLRNLCEEYGFTLLMVTHNELHESAHIHYKFKSDKDDKLLIDKIIKNTDNDYLDNDYFDINIKLFQSIEQLQLQIKGLTVFTGSSDIGKSSIVRAFNSIILNDFKDNYPSDFAKRGNYTRIELQKHITKDNYDSIALEYRQGSVYYYLQDGTEYKGKSLAQDKINKLLADFGFKKIDTSIYKNWKGNLEAQTTRVFVTTQHDTSYFSTEKNATEKLLTLLFNSHMFNDAIVTVDSKLREKELSVKDINKQIEYETIEMMRLYIDKCKSSISMIDNTITQINESQSKINSLNNDIDSVNNNINSITDYIDNVAKLQLINDHHVLLCDYNYINLKNKSINETINESQNIINKLNELYNISKAINQELANKELNESILLQLSNISNQIIICSNVIDSLNAVINIRNYSNVAVNNKNIINSINVMSTQLSIITDVVNKLSDYDLNDYDSTINKYNNVINQINTLNSVISKQQNDVINCQTNINLLNSQLIELQKIDLIDSYIAISVNIDNTIKSINNINNYLNEGIHQEFNLKECKICKGIGYVHNH